jgi:hypothetical protein
LVAGGYWRELYFLQDLAWIVDGPVNDIDVPIFGGE